MAADALRLGCVFPEQLAIIHHAAEVAEQLPVALAVPTASDYTPGNWLVNPSGKLAAIIDFENMSWGTRIDPFVRLKLDYFPEHPSRSAAFLQGYGADPTAQDQERFWVACVIYAAYHAIAGAELGDPQHSRTSDRTFQLVESKPIAQGW
jgi:hypothetical protein